MRSQAASFAALLLLALACSEPSRRVDAPPTDTATHAKKDGTTDSATAADTLTDGATASNDAESVVDAGSQEDGAAQDSPATDTNTPDTNTPDTQLVDVKTPDTTTPDATPPDGQNTADTTPDTTPDTTNIPSDVLSSPDTSCKKTKELCDNIDNDCDGLTDEDFTMLTPMSATPLKLGDSCDNPMCPGGKVTCDNPKYAWCDTCPKNITLGAQLAPPSAKPSPLVATGGFVDVTAQLPLKGILPTKGGPVQVPPGVSGMALDVDDDGDEDLVWLHGKHTVTLLTQTTAWQFSAAVVLQSKAEISVLAATDLDSDGVPELLVGGDGLTLLARQKDGSYAVSPVSAAFQLPNAGGTVQHLTSADLNGDGLLDIVVSLFSCDGSKQALRVYINRGGHGYDEQSAALGLGLQATAWATLASDYNNDGRLDLLVLTESCAPKTGVALYLAQPDVKPGVSPSPRFKIVQQDGVFTAPIGPVKGSPMGAAAADVNGDGVLDYLLAEIELRNFEQFGGSVKQIDPLNPALHSEVSNVFLLSQPGGKRTRAGLEAGLWAPLSVTDKTMVAWSPVWRDLDHDGHLDLLLSHGYDYGSWVVADQGSMRPVIFRHDGTGHFVDVSAAWGLPKKHPARAMVLDDLDHDGDDDLVLGGQLAGGRVYRNDLKHGGADVRVRLIGATSNRWGLGARVRLHTNERVLLAEMGAVAAAQTMAPPALHFALRPKEQAQKIVVTWPTGWQGTTQLVAPGGVAAGGGVALGKGGWLTLTEPALVSLSTRWSPAGAVPVTITAVDLASNGLPKVASNGCTIAFDGGVTGTFAGPTVCQGATCKRTWKGPAKAGGDVAFAVSCGGKTWTIRPRIYL